MCRECRQGGHLAEEQTTVSAVGLVLDAGQHHRDAAAVRGVHERRRDNDFGFDARVERAIPA